MPEVLIGAGSNADPERRLALALAELELRFGAVRCSKVYRSAAIGLAAADYLNFVAVFQTALAADRVREELRTIEALAGRTRADVPVVELDLDLLLYGARIDAERRLPRPGLFALPFVVVPLAQLRPELVHPVTGERCADAAHAAARGSLDDVGVLRRA